MASADLTDGLFRVRRRLSGATLIEMLVVVAMVALLAAILLPSLAAARRQAQRLACGNQLRTVGAALNLYRSALGRYPVPGDRNPGAMFGSFWNPDDPRMFRPPSSLTEIGDLAEALTFSSLGDPWAMYCPSSLQRDRHASKPYARSSLGSRPKPTWRTGQISYMYLVGLDYRQAESRFPDATGRPTFDPTVESPERRWNRANARAVLFGDRVVEIIPPHRNIPGSNHGREGGWFYFTSGDARWSAWSQLTAHPTSMYVWYWPRTHRLAPAPSPIRAPTGQPSVGQR